MTINAAKKVGFWTAVAMLFGSIVGIGIFFKNGSITSATGGNGTATLLAWVIGGLVSLFAAISFSEIGSQKLRNVHGLAAWSEIALGKKFGYFTRFNLSFFYYGILTVIFGVFVSESFFQIIASGNNSFKNPPVWVHVIVGVALDAFFISLDFASVAKASWISRFSTALKLVPLVTAALAGIILANTNNAVDKDALAGINGFTNGQSFSFAGLLAALPAVLFAYDAFLDVGTYGSKVKGGSKTVSKAIVFTLVSALVLYSIISVSHIIHGAGSVSGLFKQIFPTSAQKGINTFVWVFLFFSSCGVQNGVTAAAVTATEQAVSTHTIFGTKTLTYKFGERKAAWITQAIIFTIWATPIFITAIVVKSDAIVDAISNFPTLFFFAIYGLNIFGYALKRDKLESEKINSKVWWTASVLALIGITFITGYQLVYGFTIQAFLHTTDASSAGFLKGDIPLTLIELFGVFISCFVIFFTFPIINWFLCKKVEGHHTVIDTQSLNSHAVELI